MYILSAKSCAPPDDPFTIGCFHHLIGRANQGLNPPVPGVSPHSKPLLRHGQGRHFREHFREGRHFRQHFRQGRQLRQCRQLRQGRQLRQVDIDSEAQRKVQTDTNTLTITLWVVCCARRGQWAVEGCRASCPARVVSITETDSDLKGVFCFVAEACWSTSSSTQLVV